MSGVFIANVARTLTANNNNNMTANPSNVHCQQFIFFCVNFESPGIFPLFKK